MSSVMIFQLTIPSILYMAQQTGAAKSVYTSAACHNDRHGSLGHEKKHSNSSEKWCGLTCVQTGWPPWFPSEFHCWCRGLFQRRSEAFHLHLPPSEWGCRQSCTPQRSTCYVHVLSLHHHPRVPQRCCINAQLGYAFESPIWCMTCTASHLWLLPQMCTCVQKWANMSCCYNTTDNLTILEERKIVLLLCARNEQSK